MGYGLMPEYVGKLVRIQITNKKVGEFITTNREFLQGQKLEAAEDALSEEEQSTERKICENFKKLQIKEEVFAYIDDNFSDERKTYFVHYKEDGQMLKKEVQSFSKRELAHLVANGIRNKEWEFTLDPWGRLHTLITRMPSSLRQFLHYGDGEDLVQVDIKSSQIICMYQNFEKMDEEISQGKISMNIIETQEDIKTQSNILNSSYHPKNRLLPKEELSRELQEMETLVMSGQFLDALLEKMKEIDPSCQKTAKELKLPCFSCLLFCSNLWFYSRESLIYKAFSAKFPRCNLLMQYQKKDDYGVFAREMQGRESDFVLRKVCKDLLEMGIDLYTIHDSIAVRERHVDTVIEIMNKYLPGIPLTIKR